MRIPAESELATGLLELVMADVEQEQLYAAETERSSTLCHVLQVAQTPRRRKDVVRASYRQGICRWSLTHRHCRISSKGCVRKSHRVACREKAYRICRNEKDALQASSVPLPNIMLLSFTVRPAT